MRTPPDHAPGADDAVAGGVASTRLEPLHLPLHLPLRLLLRFSDAATEQRYLRHCVDVYLRYAQASLVLGVLLIIGDWGVDHIAQPGGQANLLRLTAAVPVLLAGIAYSMLPQARRHWQPVMACFIVAVALCLFAILLRIDAEGGAGLTSWVGVLNFTFLAFYGFVVLGVQFRHALAACLAILAGFLGALWVHPGQSHGQAAYGSYHVLTVFILAGGIGWWREFLQRKAFAARIALEDSRAAAEQRAQRLAHYDEVTGLPNRRLFHELAAPALTRSRQRGVGCAVLHVEIDRLGGIHDVYDRGQVDLLLAGIAQRLRGCVRHGDPEDAGPGARAPSVLARLGDHAFALLIADLDGQEQASLVARRLLAAAAQPVDVATQPVLLSASIGIAMFPGDAQDMGDLTRCAEQSARAAAAAGGARHTFFDEQRNARARARVLLEAELRQAIGGGQLRLHYQPQIDARDGRLVGAEALVRWQHPVHGLLPPDRFIPLAEDGGQILPLTDWVLHAACHSLRRWADLGLPAITLSVNLAAASLADPGLPGQLAGLVQQYGLAPRRLTLELTETMVMRDVATTVDVLDALHGLGFGLSLDDFGTGYASLSHLKRLPMSELKIDRAFVADAANGGRDAALATAIITLGRELGLQVVAEGVETAGQSAFLTERGCALQQGFLFAKPVPLEAFEALLSAGAG